jgi:hypothetical protein
MSVLQGKRGCTWHQEFERSWCVTLIQVSYTLRERVSLIYIVFSYGLLLTSCVCVCVGTVSEAKRLLNKKIKRI